MDINIPNKFRLFHSCDGSSAPLRQAANAITHIYPRLRIALSQLAGMPPQTLLRLEQDLDLLHAVVMHDQAADKTLIDAIDRIYVQIGSAELSGDDAVACDIAQEELFTVRASWQSVVDRIEAERTLYEALLVDR